jgi:hypothetical protein
MRRLLLVALALVSLGVFVNAASAAIIPLKSKFSPADLASICAQGHATFSAGSDGSYRCLYNGGRLIECNQSHNCQYVTPFRTGVGRGGNATNAGGLGNTTNVGGLGNTTNAGGVGKPSAPIGGAGLPAGPVAGTGAVGGATAGGTMSADVNPLCRTSKRSCQTP